MVMYAYIHKHKLIFFAERERELNVAFSVYDFHQYNEDVFLWF